MVPFRGWLPSVIAHSVRPWFLYQRHNRINICVSSHAFKMHTERSSVALTQRASSDNVKRPDRSLGVVRLRYSEGCRHPNLGQAPITANQCCYTVTHVKNNNNSNKSYLLRT